MSAFRQWLRKSQHQHNTTVMTVMTCRRPCSLLLPLLSGAALQGLQGHSPSRLESWSWWYIAIFINMFINIVPWYIWCNTPLRYHYDIVQIHANKSPLKSILFFLCVVNLLGQRGQSLTLRPLAVGCLRLRAERMHPLPKLTWERLISTG